MRARGILAAIAGVLALAWAPQALAAGPFSNWAVAVVAGDWHAHTGGPSEAFDNARRDVSAALAKVGFDPANIRQFSVRPERYKDTRPRLSEARTIFEGLSEAAAKATRGCLMYFSSHGAPQGVLVGQHVMPPAVLGEILDRACGTRPTVVVISACYSGVFIPELATSNRMILTAARPDRTSFGCGESDKYPYFDDCFLQSIAATANFPALATAAQACVKARETKEGMRPPSEPQVYIGPGLRPELPLYPFQRPPPS